MALNPGEWSSESLWTCFAFDDIDPNDLHCTHKFLDEQTPEERGEILKVVDSYFELVNFEPFMVRFDRVDFFGPEKDVRVLRPNVDDLSLFLPDLRALLDDFKEDNWPEYSPHISAPTAKVVDKFFTRYCVMQGETTLKEYR